jgi:SAM-dependent methyltransferase/ABC-type transporter Mla subunit MlaD
VTSQRTAPSDGASSIERFTPGEHGPLPAYEHAHRYALAALAVSKGSRVLDLACGSGYGTEILRRAGARVLPVDLDPGVLRRSRSGVCARAERLPFASASFDAVICFEAIEHVREPAVAVAEIARVLAPQGFALISTPDKAIYSDRVGNRNPHHLSEMDRSDFSALLEGAFRKVALYGQSVWAGSWMVRLLDGKPPEKGPRHPCVLLDPLASEEGAAPWVEPGEQGFPTPLFLVAACAVRTRAARRLERRIGRESLLHDPCQHMIASYLDALHGLQHRDRQIEELAKHARALMDRVSEKEARIEDLATHAQNLDEILSGLRKHEENLKELLRSRDEHVAGLTHHTQNLEQFLPGLRQHAENLEALLRSREEQVAGLELHGRNLEQLAQGYLAHAQNLEQLADGYLAHARNLEVVLSARTSEVATSRERIATLEAAVARLAEQPEAK